MAAEEEEVKDRLADTNMENYGGDEHRAKQKAIADKMPEWKGAGDEVGIQAWRIEKFKVKHVDPDTYGSFYNGDSYIILNTYLEGDTKLHNVHFWLGEGTSQDEAGAAAIKTVELDDKLGDLPVQYREVQGHETKKFLDLFPNMSIMEGGVESGFKHVTPDQYEPRLFHIKGNRKRVLASQVPIALESLNSTDCFILDLGLELLQFRGPSANMAEKWACTNKVNDINSERNGKVKEKPIIDWNEESPMADKFWSHFGGKPDSLPKKSCYKEKKAREEEYFANHVNQMIHITDEGGNLVTETKQEGVLDRGILEEENDDVLIIDVGRVMFVWIGATANSNEIRHGMCNAQKYLYESGRPKWVPIERIKSGGEPAHFWRAFGCEKVPADII